MSLGELMNNVPQNIRADVDKAFSQLPWDIHSDIGSVYLAVLTQHTGWARPGMFHSPDAVAEQQAAIGVDQDADAPDPDTSHADLRYA